MLKIRSKTLPWAIILKFLIYLESKLDDLSSIVFIFVSSLKVLKYLFKIFFSCLLLINEWIFRANEYF